MVTVILAIQSENQSGDDSTTRLRTKKGKIFRFVVAQNCWLEKVVVVILFCKMQTLECNTFTVCIKLQTTITLLFASWMAHLFILLFFFCLNLIPAGGNKSLRVNNLNRIDKQYGTASTLKERKTFGSMFPSYLSWFWFIINFLCYRILQTAFQQISLIERAWIKMNSLISFSLFYLSTSCYLWLFV